MEQKKIRKAEEGLWEQKKKQIILGIVAVVVVMLMVIGGILYKVYAGQGTVGGMLKIYYETMYSENGKSFDDLCNCLAPELKAEYYMNVTNGGANFTQLNKWRGEAIANVGDNVKVDVEVLEKTPSTVGALGAIKQQLPNAEEMVGVEFQVTLTGDTGFIKMKGYVACVREGDDWYLSTPTVELGIIERSPEA